MRRRTHDLVRHILPALIVFLVLAEVVEQPVRPTPLHKLCELEKTGLLEDPVDWDVPLGRQLRLQALLDAVRCRTLAAFGNAVEFDRDKGRVLLGANVGGAQLSGFLNSAAGEGGRQKEPKGRVVTRVRICHYRLREDQRHLHFTERADIDLLVLVDLDGDISGDAVHS